MQNNDYLINFYNEYDEDGRLENNRLGKVEYLTTRRYLDPLLTADCKIAEIGAGTGRYSVTLAKEGYDVTAVELVQHNLDNWYNIILTFLKASLMAARTSKHISAMRLT